jgi:two-component system response regulator HydG
MKKETILIVDDSIEMLEVLSRNLSALNFHVFQSNSVKEAIEIVKSSCIDLLITDLQMPVADGMLLVKYVAEHFPGLPTLVITGFPSVSGAIEALKTGAVDYLVKPFTQSELKEAVEKSLFRIRLEKESKDLLVQTKSKPTTSAMGIIGNSEQVKELSEIISRVNTNKATVFLQGESGTGKELVARAIHYSGNLSKEPFIAVNCGGIPENLLESELFGFVKGAFTGAHETRAGFFQAADGGTIFLDEIGNASLNVQSRLLRVLQEKEITMIGATRPQKINVRIISATNADLMQLCKNGSFREDLYYRLNVVSIVVPPLRERKVDIPILTNYFIDKFSREYAKERLQVSDKVLEIFMRYSWPGNIRELENVVQRCVIMAKSEIQLEDLPDHFKFQIPNKKSENQEIKSLKEHEKEYIQHVLTLTGFNKSKASMILGIDRKTLRQKLD